MSHLTIPLPPGVDPEEARLLLSMKLFETGRLSLGQAAQMASRSKRAYAELLGEQGIPIIDYPADELARELED